MRVSGKEDNIYLVDNVRLRDLHFICIRNLSGVNNSQIKKETVLTKEHGRFTEVLNLADDDTITNLWLSIMDYYNTK